jgi:type VI secretion system protein ImpE
MDQARELYRDGKLTEAISCLQLWLRDHPGDRSARSFLFELLCFAGEFERARKQLVVLGQESGESHLGVAFYLSALTAEVERQGWYGAPEDDAPYPLPDELGAPQTGTWNGQPFAGIRDLDGRLGGKFEFLAAGKYHRVDFKNIRRVEFVPPARLRDMYWRSATLTFSDELNATEAEILVPALYPATFLFDDDQTRLGRTTDFALNEAGEEVPCGQRVLILGKEEVPIMDLQVLELDAIPGAADDSPQVG